MAKPIACALIFSFLLSSASASSSYPAAPTPRPWPRAVENDSLALRSPGQRAAESSIFLTVSHGKPEEMDVSQLAARRRLTLDDNEGEPYCSRAVGKLTECRGFLTEGTPLPLGGGKECCGALWVASGTSEPNTTVPCMCYVVLDKSFLGFGVDYVQVASLYKACEIAPLPLATLCYGELSEQGEEEKESRFDKFFHDYRKIMLEVLGAVILTGAVVGVVYANVRRVTAAVYALVRRIRGNGAGVADVESGGDGGGSGRRADENSGPRLELIEEIVQLFGEVTKAENH